MSFILCGVAKCTLHKDQGFCRSGRGVISDFLAGLAFLIVLGHVHKRLVIRKGSKRAHLSFSEPRLLSWMCGKRLGAHCVGCGSGRELYSDLDLGTR